jgi:uncharacterized cupredoxin-like copper-binding protein
MNFLKLGLSCLLSVLLAIVFIVSAPAIAAPDLIGDLSKQPAIEVQISLGTSANDLKFIPDTLEFLAGKRYRLLLSNPSSLKHYFTAKDFADNIWNQKVEAGNVEVKGAIHEIELKPGAQAEWVFVPVKSGSYELHCSVPGHTAAGMVGQVIISAVTR